MSIIVTIYIVFLCCDLVFAGLLSREKRGGCQESDDLCSIISSTTEMFTSLDITDSITDLTSSSGGSSDKTLEENNASDHNITIEHNTSEDKQENKDSGEQRSNVNIIQSCGKLVTYV